MATKTIALITGWLAIGAAPCVSAAVVEGTFEGFVTAASDPGQAAFGRDPSDWVGREVSGTFRYDVDTPGVSDQNPAGDFWGYGDSARNVDWVNLEIVIDGVTFRATPLTVNTAGTVAGGVVIADDGYGGGDWYGVQHSYAIFGGRSVVGVDVFGPPTMFSYFGSGGAVDFDFGATPGAFGVGLIEDLYEPGGIVERYGLIQFELTRLSFGSTPAQLVADLLTSVRGSGRNLERTVALAQTYYAVPDLRATCAVLRFFDFQVRVTYALSTRARRPWPWVITMEQMDDWLGQSGAIQIELGCNSP